MSMLISTFTDATEGPSEGPLGDLLRLIDRLSAAEGLENVLNEILSAAMHLTQSEMGHIGLYDSDKRQLQGFAHRGFPADYVTYFLSHRVPVKGGPSETALARRERVIVHNAFNSPLFEPYLSIVKMAGFQAMQATPLFSRTNEPVGTICTYSATGEVPSAERLRLLDTYAQLASDAIERERNRAERELADEAMRRSEERYRHLYEVIVDLSGTNSTDEVLSEILVAVRQITGANAGLIRLRKPDEEGLPVVAARGMSESFVAEISALPLDKGSPSLEAMNLRRQVVLESISAYPRLNPHLEIVYAAGFRSMQATPLITRAGESIGVFATYFIEEHAPSTEDLQVLHLYARLAADTLERQERHDQQLRSEQDLRHALAAKDEFLGLVSHELRTPMTVIRGLTSVLNRHSGFDEGTLRQTYRDLGEESERLYRLIENMLTLSRARVTRQENPEPVLLDKLLESCVADATREMPDLVLHIGPIPRDVMVLGTPSHVTQILRNLLENARKYSPLGSVVDLDVISESEYVKISVSDRGIGLNNPAALFEPFKREKEAEKRASGLGLGLAVCRTLTESFGGTIWAASREGGGSRFTFTLRTDLSKE